MKNKNAAAWCRAIVATGMLACNAAVLAQTATPAACPNPIRAPRVDDPIPPASNLRSQRIGGYHWTSADADGRNGAGDPIFSCGRDCPPDRLNWVADRLAAMGSRVIRVTLSPADVYDHTPDGRVDMLTKRVRVCEPADDGTRRLRCRFERVPLTLAEVARLPHYARLFADPRFDTILLTTYSAEDQRNQWLDGFDCEEYERSKAEIADLGATLLGTPAFAGKRFVLLNWEGDHAFDGCGDGNIGCVGAVSTRQLDQVAWINSRVDGVHLARAAVPRSQAHVHAGFEFFLTFARRPRIDSAGGEPYLKAGRRVRCGEADADGVVRDCVASTTLGLMDVDYVSYSAWETVNVYYRAIDGTALADDLRANLQLAINYANPARRARGLAPLGFDNMIVGEYGIASPDTMRDWLCALDSVRPAFSSIWATLPVLISAEDNNALTPAGEELRRFLPPTRAATMCRRVVLVDDTRARQTAPAR